MTANSMIRSFHAARSRARWSEETFRDWLETRYGTRHISELGAKAPIALRALNGLADANPAPEKTGKRKKLSGKYLPILQALWLSGWNLGVFDSPDDAALLVFVKRQSKIDHTRFLIAHADAKKVIEALKSWIAREGGVDWSACANPQDAVIAAQMKKLGITANELPEATDRVELMQLLGERIREAK